MKPKVIEIVGGIGSGKSQVRLILESMGYSVADCDVMAKQVADMPQTTEAVRSLLGDKAVTSDNKLDRVYIRNVVFTNADLTKKYTELFTEQIKILLQLYVDKHDSEKFVFVEVSVPDSLDYAFDQVWLVDAPVEVRVRRVVARDGVTEQNVADIMLRQPRYKGHIDVVLNNDGTLESLSKQLRLVLDKLNK